MRVNLFGSVLCCRAVLPHFRANGYGKIIQLSGGGATSPLPRLSAYAASKAAVVRFAETLAEEVRGTGIDVNAIAPGALNTRLLDEVLEAGPERVGDAFYERALEQRSSGGTPLDLAGSPRRLPRLRRQRRHHREADQRAVGPVGGFPLAGPTISARQTSTRCAASSRPTAGFPGAEPRSAGEPRVSSFGQWRPPYGSRAGHGSRRRRALALSSFAAERPPRRREIRRAPRPRGRSRSGTLAARSGTRRARFPAARSRPGRRRRSRRIVRSFAVHRRCPAREVDVRENEEPGARCVDPQRHRVGGVVLDRSRRSRLADPHFVRPPSQVRPRSRRCSARRDSTTAWRRGSNRSTTNAPFLRRARASRYRTRHPRLRRRGRRARPRPVDTRSGVLVDARVAIPADEPQRRARSPDRAARGRRAPTARRTSGCPGTGPAARSR